MELVVYSDQYWYYKIQPYRALLAPCGVTQSMNRKGNCIGNAAVESFFGTLKAECFRLTGPNSLDTLKVSVHD